MNYILLILFAALLSVGQVLFKKAALAGENATALASFVNIWMVAALVFYGAATLLWVWILRTVPLSIAYPFAALGFILVPMAAVLFFGETLSWRYLLGGVLIVAGVALTGSS